MKAWNYFALLPLVVITLRATSPAVGDLVLPEEIYPQLDSILKRAVRQAPGMLDRSLEMEIAENSRIEARSGILPSVGGSGRFVKAEDKRADLEAIGQGPLKVDKAYYDFSVNQPLFHWGERRNNLEIATIRKKVSEGDYREGYRLLAQEIRRQYFQLILRKIYLERWRISHQFNQSSLKLAEERLKQKVTSEAEIFGVRINAERTEMELARLEYEFGSMKKSFSRLTGVPITDDDIASEIPEVTPKGETLNQLLAEFLSQKEPLTPQAVKLRSQIEIDTLAYRNQKTRLLPKFSVTAGINQDEQSYTTNVANKYRVTSLYAGISVSWTVFDGFATRAGKRSALARRTGTENQYRQLTEQLAQDAQTQVTMLNFSARSMSVWNRILVSAAGSYQVRQAEFARGVVSENNVTQDHLAYYDALLNASNARIDYLIKVVDFLGLVAADPVLENAPIN